MLEEELAQTARCWAEGNLLTPDELAAAADETPPAWVADRFTHPDDVRGLDVMGRSIEERASLMSQPPPAAVANVLVASDAALKAAPEVCCPSLFWSFGCSVA